MRHDPGHRGASGPDKRIKKKPEWTMRQIVTAVACLAGSGGENSLETQADAELARRAPAGMLVFASLVPFLLLSCDFFRVHRLATVVALVTTYVSLAARAWLIWRGGRLFCSRRRLWLTLHHATVLPPIAMWDVFYCLTAVHDGPESWDSLLLLLCMVCTCFGALHSFTPKLYLLYAYQWTMLIGPALVDLFVKSPHHWMIAAAIIALLLFTTMQGKVLHTQYGTDLKAQQSLREAMLNAKSASEAKSAFLANMSHEIRTPLNGVLGMIAVMLEGELSEEHREHLELARQSGLLLQGILNDVLDISKIEAGKVVLELRDFDLKATLEEIVGLMETQASQKGLELRLNYPDAVPVSFRGDAGKIRQVTLNYLGNALKFTTRGSITVSVSMQNDGAVDQRVKIAVCDTGIGIRAEQQSRLFEKFIQADASTTRKYGGTGLGLAICKRLAELMGGEVGVISAPDAGSTFWAAVPLLPIAAPERVDRTASGGNSNKRWRGRVLVVEDNLINQKIVARLLERRGLAVDTAANGRDALQMINNARYCLVFMDCQMPEMDGYQATREIRGSEYLRSLSRLPIVAMTANAMAGDRELCLDAGMDDYVSKPVGVNELERVLSRWAESGCAALDMPSPSR